MKKTYTKPEILFESFTLSTNIAGTCEIKTYLPSNNTCGMEWEGVGIVFMETMTGCTDVKISEGGNFDGICYHVPTETSNLFNS